MALTNAEKSKRYRDRKRKEKEDIAAGIIEPKHVISFEVSKSELDTLTQMGINRAGCREPYEPNDYAVTLLRSVMPLDVAKYQEQIQHLGTCDYCDSQLPKGCGGAFKGQRECYHTSKYRDLELCRVTLSL